MISFKKFFFPFLFFFFKKKLWVSFRQIGLGKDHDEEEQKERKAQEDDVGVDCEMGLACVGIGTHFDVSLKPIPSSMRMMVCLTI